MVKITILIIIILTSLGFAFVNGFQDAANAIATTISTRALSPTQAIILARTLNFLGALAHTGVAVTVGKGIIKPQSINLTLLLAALIGAIIWNIIATYYGIPVSVTHSLIGGLLGSGLAFGGREIIITSGLSKVIKAMFLSPLFGFLGGFIFLVTILWLFRKVRPVLINKIFLKLQIFSASWMAFSHGMNDAQNAMGIIAIALFSTGIIKTFHIPLWVMLASALAIGLGTSFGGWRVIKTLGQKIIDLKAVHGFAAETSAALTIFGMSLLGAPISTTHVISTAVVGVGATKRISAVRWGIVGHIFRAWIYTIPASALFSYIFAYFFLGLGFVI